MSLEERAEMIAQTFPEGDWIKRNDSFERTNLIREEAIKQITEAVAEERAKWECDGMATHEATEPVDIEFAIATAEKLARRDEREACAKVADKSNEAFPTLEQLPSITIVTHIAAAIRARSSDG